MFVDAIASAITTLVFIKPRKWNFVLLTITEKCSMYLFYSICCTMRWYFLWNAL